MEWSSIGINNINLSSGASSSNLGTFKIDKGKRKLLDDEIDLTDDHFDSKRPLALKIGTKSQCSRGNGVNGSELYASLSAAAEERAEQERVESNPDYKAVSACLNFLRTQLERAESDLEQLKRLKQDALANPVQFIKLLVQRKAPKCPSRQRIAVIPDVNFVKYQQGGQQFSSDQMLALLKLSKLTLPQQATLFCKIHTDIPDSELFPMRLPAAEPAVAEPVVAGEHAKRREPSGTPHSESLIQSVQALSRNAFANYSNRISGARYLATPRVLMSESSSGADVLDPKIRAMLDKDPQLIHQPEIQQLIRLEQQKRCLSQATDTPAAKIPQQVRDMYKPVHHGFSCDGCGTDPIIGNRNHCNDCAVVDLCDKCVSGKWEGKSHLHAHSIAVVQFPD